MAAKKAGDAPPTELSTEVTAEPVTTVAQDARPEPAAIAVATGAAAQFDTANKEAKTNMEKAMKTAEDMVTFGQGNLEAIVRSSQIWAAGMQDLGKQVAASAQAQVDQTMATFKALAGVKSLKEALELQSTLARSSVEKAVAETGKLTDASLKLAEQTLAPITARVSLAAERFGRAV